MASELAQFTMKSGSICDASHFRFSEDHISGLLISVQVHVTFHSFPEAKTLRHLLQKCMKERAKYNILLKVEFCLHTQMAALLKRLSRVRVRVEGKCFYVFYFKF